MGARSSLVVVVLGGRVITSMTSVMTWIALGVLFLASLLVRNASALYVSPYPCNGEENCPPYYRSPDEQFYEVWMGEDDDWSPIPSYVYVEERADVWADYTFMESESYTFVLIDTSKTMKLKIQLCSSDWLGDPRQGRLCDGTIIDLDNVDIKCYMSQCSWSYEEEGDGTFVTFNIDNLDLVEGAQALSVELFGDEYRQNSLFVFFMNEADYIECPDNSEFQEDGSITFTGPDIDNQENGYWDLNDEDNNDGAYFIAKGGQVCLQFGAYVRGFLRSAYAATTRDEGPNRNKDQDLYCGDSTGGLVRGFGGIWRSGYGNKGGKNDQEVDRVYQNLAKRQEDKPDLDSPVAWGNSATIAVCGDDVTVKDIAVVGAIGSNANINVNSYYSGGCFLDDNSEVYCFSRGVVDSTKILGAFDAGGTDGIDGLEVDGQALNNFVICTDDSLKPMEDRQYFNGNVVWQLENGFVIAFAWNAASEDYKVVMNTDIWHSDHGESSFCIEGDTYCINYGAVIGAVWAATCRLGIEFGRVNNVRILGDIHRLFAFSTSDNLFSRCEKDNGYYVSGTDNCDGSDLDEVNYDVCSQGYFDNFYFGLFEDGDNSGWGLQVYGVQENKSILWGPYDYSITDFGFEQTIIDGILITDENKYDFFEENEFSEEAYFGPNFG